MTSPFHQGVSEKLGKGNFLLWKAQVLPAIRGAQMVGYIDGSTKAPAKELTVGEGDAAKKVPNADYAQWAAQDQQVYGFIFNSLSREVMAHVLNTNTARELYEAIVAMFSARTRARTVNTRIALATTKKLPNMTMAEYVAKMKGYGDEMTSAGKTLDDEDMVSYLIAGLDEKYDALVAAVLARETPISVSDLYSQLVNFESRQHLLHGSGSSQSSANAATRGGRGGFNHGGGRGNYNNNGGRGRGNGNPNQGGQNGGGYQGGRGGYNNSGRGRGNQQGGDGRPRCQLCNVTGHVVKDCWYRYDENFVPRERSASAATNTNNGNGEWNIDTGATDHITGELDRLTTRDKYQGNDQVYTANGGGSGHEEGSS